MSTGLPDAPNGGMNLRNAASRSGGIAISDSPLSTTASDNSTPDPPAPEDFKPVWEAWNARSPEDQAALSVAANEALVARIETLNAEQRAGFHVTMFGRMPVDLAGVLGLSSPHGLAVAPFLLITALNLVGMVLLWLACLDVLARRPWSEAHPVPGATT